MQCELRVIAQLTEALDVDVEDADLVGALRKAAEGHDVSIQALSHREKTGASFADFAASAKELTGNKD